MASRWGYVVVDCSDVKAVSRFWAEALGYRVLEEADDEVYVGREDTWPRLVFGTVPEAKSVKNRLHIDLDPDDQEAEVRRLEGIGARRIDIGQGETTWVVMADPEGNEFCVLQARPQE